MKSVNRQILAPTVLIALGGFLATMLCPFPAECQAGPTARHETSEQPEMVLIPAGEFVFGTHNLDDENLVFKIQMSAFYISKTPVTVAQYKVFCQATNRKMPSAPAFNPNWMKKTHPIVNVTWDDAKAYCDWLGKQTGRPYRLPTEAQWERAARGGEDGKKFPWGNDFDPGKLQCSKTRDGDAGGTAPVASFPANGFGLYDMAGNVYQWCADFYDYGFFQSKQGKLPDPENKTKASSHVRRGGGWAETDPNSFLCAKQSWLVSTGWGASIGFRCVYRAGAVVPHSPDTQGQHNDRQ